MHAHREDTQHVQSGGQLYEWTRSRKDRLAVDSHDLVTGQLSSSRVDSLADCVLTMQQLACRVKGSQVEELEFPQHARQLVQPLWEKLNPGGECAANRGRSGFCLMHATCLSAFCVPAATRWWRGSKRWHAYTPNQHCALHALRGPVALAHTVVWPPDAWMSIDTPGSSSCSISSESHAPAPTSLQLHPYVHKYLRKAGE